MKILISSLLATISLPLCADTFIFNTDAGTLTREGSGIALTEFGGSTLTTSVSSGESIRIFSWDGDLNLGFGNTYLVRGSNGLRIRVEGNLWLPFDSRIDASATGQLGHGGGGNGGDIARGGIGGAGGVGSSVAGGGGGTGADEGNGSNGSQGGRGNSGGRGGSSSAFNGQDGIRSVSSGGVINRVIAGGDGGQRNNGIPVAGGNGGTGTSGGDGADGVNGPEGNDGANCDGGSCNLIFDGLRGKNASLHTSGFTLVGGGGGTSGVSGAGGGGGSSGSAGSGGGGGSANEGFTGDAAGGDGGSGGRPGNGGRGDTGGFGGNGGGGGGVIDIIVDGIFTWDGFLLANGGEGGRGNISFRANARFGSSGETGDDGEDGERVITRTGGDGGDGGNGGKGGDGGTAGEGGNGAGGAGGSIQVAADRLAGNDRLSEPPISIQGGEAGGIGAQGGDLGQFQQIPPRAFGHDAPECKSIARISAPFALLPATDLIFKTAPGALLFLQNPSFGSIDPFRNNDDLTYSPVFQAFEETLRVRADLNFAGNSLNRRAFFQASTTTSLDRIGTKYQEDFEGTNSGFTFSTPNTSRSFEIGDPREGGDIGPGPAPSGVKCLATAIGGNYANGLDTSATSPLLDIQPTNILLVSYWEWFDIENGFDDASVELSFSNTNFGNFTMPLQGKFPTGERDPLQGEWIRRVYVIDVSDINGAFNLQIQFNFTSDSLSTRAGWYIDDLDIVALGFSLG